MSNIVAMPVEKGKVTVVLDSQAGSCGKGKFIGYLALMNNPAVAINNFMTNAGHTFRAGELEIMTQHLPTSIVNKTTMLCIGPGSAITPEVLASEIVRYKYLLGDRKVYVHPRAMIIKEHHRKQEQLIIRSGSTFKGCGTAQAEKVIRQAELFGQWFTGMEQLTTDPIFKEEPWYHEVSEIFSTISEHVVVADTAEIVNKAIDDGLDVIIEGSQGCDLDINYGLDYPHTTSRQCHAGQLVADCGISPMLVTDVIMIMRPYPIRISKETNIGLECNSGDYAGAEEITWDIVKERCGAPADIEFGELTTVTKKVRRVFEMSWDRLNYVSMINRPTQIVLNFAQYLDYNIEGLNTEGYQNELANSLGANVEPFLAVHEFVENVQDLTGVPVTMIGTGADNDEIIDLRRRKENE